MGPQDILKFWFEELTMKQWYIKDPKLDALIIDRYSNLHDQAIKGELFSWREHYEGRVAEVIILDQFSRNMFRESPKAYDYDVIALVLAQEAIHCGALEALPEMQQHHLLLPHMHSESLVIHDQAVELRTKYGLSLDYEIQHRDIIERFGRYPHRNRILNRTSTPEELEFLTQPGSSF